jgi:hypothetical protein
MIEVRFHPHTFGVCFAAFFSTSLADILSTMALVHVRTPSRRSDDGACLEVYEFMNYLIVYFGLHSFNASGGRQSCSVVIDSINGSVLERYCRFCCNLKVYFTKSNKNTYNRQRLIDDVLQLARC